MTGKIDTQWFKDEMRRAGLTQERLAEIMGRDRSIVSKVLAGKVAMDIHHARAFSKALGVPIAQILDRAGQSIEDAISGYAAMDADQIDRAKLVKSLRLLEKISKELKKPLSLEERAEILLEVYSASPDTPEIQLELDIYKTLHNKAADTPSAS